MTLVQMKLGDEYRHKDGRRVLLVCPHPWDGACLVVEDVDREDGDISHFSTCESSDLIERLEPYKPSEVPA
jgi:hypothetical protein